MLHLFRLILDTNLTPTNPSLRLFEAFYGSLKPSHAGASNNHFRLQTAQVGSQTSDNALQNHFNVIIEDFESRVKQRQTMSRLTLARRHNPNNQSTTDADTLRFHHVTNRVYKQSF